MKKITKFLLFVILITAIPFIGSSQTYTLPAARSVTWQGNVGVSGDIPARTTIYTTLSSSGGNDASAIQTAINNCPAGHVVKLNAGTFNVSSQITVTSGVTLRGAGMGSTIIKGTAGMTGVCVVRIGSGYTLGSSFSITGGLTKGSTTITTGSAAHGWSVGDVILIDQLNNPSDDPPVTNVGGGDPCTWCGRTSGTRSLGQLAKVSAVPTSTTATLEIPLYWNYDAGLSPQATKLSGITKDAGIENLSIDNSLSVNSNQSGSGGTIVLTGASNCWLLNVEGIYLQETMMRIKGVYRNTIRNCKFHEAVYGSSKYGMWLNPYSSANLIENNQIYNVGSGVLINGATSGNVFAYNSIANLHDPTVPNWNKSAFAFHGGHPIMNLMEGNYLQGRITADNVWGSSSHNTFFRNRTTLTPDKTGAPWDFDFQVNGRYYNVVGNVAGTVGVEIVYELNNVTLTGQAATFRLGYGSDGDGSPSGNDPNVKATLLRHGNWDSYNQTTLWNGTDNHVLPNSLYLSSEPSWWGSCPWPAIGPDLTPMYPSAGTVGSGTPWNNCIPTAYADVIVTSLSYNSATGIFTCVVKNQGSAATPTGIDIGVSYWVDGVQRTWGLVTGPLAAGATVTIGTNGGAYTIPSGTHTIKAFVDDINRFPESDENNNEFSQTITVGAPSAPTVGTITQPTCTVATGSVVLNGLPSTGTWTLTRTPGGTTTTGTGTSTTITGLAAGTYTYTVTNAAGYTSVASANVVINAQPATPTAPTVGTITQPTCTVATGGVVLNGLPSTGTWTLTRTPGGTTTTGTGTSKTITGLAAGTYTYTVTNAAGCTSVASANVVINAQPATPSAPTVGIITQPTYTVATGSVVLNGLPSTGTWTLTRTPGGTTTTGTGTSKTITVLAAGTYTYTVTNAAGCISAASANVVINPQPVGADVIVTSLSYNSATGIFTCVVKNQGSAATPTGIDIGVSYWVDGVQRTWGLVTGPLAAGATVPIGTNGGAYTIPCGTPTIMAFVDDINRFPESDENNNQFSQTITVGIPSAPTVGTITQPTYTVATGSVVLNGLPSTGTWTLTRTPGGTTTTGTGTSTTITGLVAGTYTYTVTNAAGCTSVASANVVINVQPIADVIVYSLSYNPATGIFTCVVKNQGTVATPTGIDIGVAYFVDGVQRTWGLVAGPLAAGATVTIGTNGGAYTVPCDTPTIMAYVDDINRFPESNENNNQLEVIDPFPCLKNALISSLPATTTNESSSIKVYPNPVMDELIIEFNGNNEKMNFEILNSIGQVVFKGNLLERTVVQTSSFSSGVYVIKLDNGKTFEFKKIIKK